MGDNELNQNIDDLSIGDNDISVRHKKERKELQAKIQALKKLAGKGDKKKKKEVLEEIVRLEADLDAKHADELIRIETPGNNVNADCNESVENNRNEGEPETNVRISKAQKRRDKKAAEEKVRQVEILAQEELNKSGPRNVEMVTLKKLLAERQLLMQPIASDGDCLYNAIRNQLNVTGRHVPDVSSLRHSTADYIVENKDTLKFYMTNTETGDSLDDAEFNAYCSAVRNTPAWGGQIEITALSNVLKAPIEVIQATGPATIQGERVFNEPNLIITYHRHMYSLGEHYNGTKPIQKSFQNDSGDAEED